MGNTGADCQKLDKEQDLSPLTNPNFVHQAMQSLGEQAMSPSSKTKGKAWPGLGRRLEVMRLPEPGQEGVEQKMEGMTI
jgi:type 2A phosphatase activator TIP41